VDGLTWVAVEKKTTGNGTKRSPEVEEVEKVMQKHINQRVKDGKALGQGPGMFSFERRTQKDRWTLNGNELLKDKELRKIHHGLKKAKLTTAHYVEVKIPVLKRSLPTGENAPGTSSETRTVFLMPVASRQPESEPQPRQAPSEIRENAKAVEAYIKDTDGSMNDLPELLEHLVDRQETMQRATADKMKRRFKRLETHVKETQEEMKKHVKETQEEMKQKMEEIVEMLKEKSPPPPSQAAATTNTPEAQASQVEPRAAAAAAEPTNVSATAAGKAEVASAAEKASKTPVSEVVPALEASSPAGDTPWQAHLQETLRQQQQKRTETQQKDRPLAFPSSSAEHGDASVDASSSRVVRTFSEEEGSEASDQEPLGPLQQVFFAGVVGVDGVVVTTRDFVSKLSRWTIT